VCFQCIAFYSPCQALPELQSPAAAHLGITPRSPWLTRTDWNDPRALPELVKIIGLALHQFVPFGQKGRAILTSS